MSIVRKEIRVINGAVREVHVFEWPKVKYNYADGSSVIREWSPETKQNWLIRHGWSERAAYMIAFGVSEADMQRIEND